ncbi:MAG: TetR/AcrR family transcriptional regulator [Lachnospiraceae bacterium]|nr:TetR/AcrR family transcriptional regulator [Lachnospiraceae bacterium]
MTELKNQILNGTIQVFNKKGIKFTMDDLAKNLGMSKKTIYTVFSDKNELFLAMVDYLFDGIKEAQAEIIKSEKLSLKEKIKGVLNVMPSGYMDIDFRQLYLLKDKYPKIYSQVEIRLENGWEDTFALLEKGKRDGVIRDVEIPIVKLMFEASLEQFFQRDILIKNDITYQEALNEVVEILMNGISN